MGGRDGTRERLVRAGGELALSLELPRVFAGVTTAAVAERAGVTTGSFFHHFPTTAAFVDAVCRAWMEDRQPTRDSVDEMVEALEHADLAEIVEGSLREVWSVAATDRAWHDRVRGQMVLFSHHDRPLAEPVDGLRTAGDLLGETYRRRTEDAVAGWADLLHRTGLRMAEPHTLEHMSVAMTALMTGLQIRRAVDPDAVDDELFARVGTLLSAAMTTRAGPGPSPAILPGALAGDEEDEGRSPQARAGARRRRDTRRRIAEAATGRFPRGWEDVSGSDVAEWSDVSTQTVFNVFRSVRAVAATTFARHLPELERAAAIHRDDDPREALHDTLRALARLAGADPEPARALLGERLEATLHHGAELGEHDIRREVPLIAVLLPLLGRLDLGDLDPADVAGSLINFTIAQAVPRPGRAEETAGLAMRLLPATAAADPAAVAVADPAADPAAVAVADPAPPVT